MNHEQNDSDDNEEELTRSGPTDIYEEVLQQKARCNVVLGSKNEVIQVLEQSLLGQCLMSY